MTMNVAITMRPIEKGVSGSGMHLHRLLSAFVELPHGCRLTFLRNTDQNIDLYRHGDTIKISRNPIRAGWELKDRKFDIVHYSPLSALSPIGLRSARKCATLHPDDELIIPECYSWKRRIHSRYFVGIYARMMDRIFTVSRTSRDLIKQCYGVPEDRMTLTPNAVDTKYRRLDEAEIGDARERLVGGARFVLHISNFSERKNPWALLRAFAAIAETEAGRDLRFVIVGNGWATDSGVAKAIQELRLEQKVVFTGFVDEADIPRLLNLAEVFLFPSLSEGFGMPNLEAMACGCPVVTSDAFAIPEVVGEGALVVADKTNPQAIADSVLQVINDGPLRANLIERGFRRVRDFSWQRSAEALLQGYREMHEGA